MSQKQEPKEKSSLQFTDEKRRMSRRGFLKASAAGMLVLPTLGCSTEADISAPQQENGLNGADNAIDDAAPDSPATGPRDNLPANQTNPPDYSTQADTWVEPWEWVQRDWPGQSLSLNVTEHAAPVAIFGDIKAAQDANVGQLLFSYGGISPGPTIRVRGDEVLHLKVRNMLGPNDGILFIPASLSEDKQTINNKTRPDYCRPIHVNHKHQIRTTNIHTHGLHVRPYLNPDGKNSDNIFLRIVPQADYELRQKGVPQPDGTYEQDPECWPLKGSEILGGADFEYRLGSSGPSDAPDGLVKVPVHPLGTHWYHPHPHGATFTQVASGMAGLIVVEGELDDYLKEQLGYNERPFVIQRILGPTAVDIEAGFEKNNQKKTKATAAFPAVNGQSLNAVDNFIVVQPGAIERWRVLNAAVDGQGYLEFFVLANDDDLIIETDPPQAPLGTDNKVTYKITWKDKMIGNTDEELKALYDDLDGSLYGGEGSNDPPVLHLASDGITLVTNEGQDSRYTTRPVSRPFMLAPANRADFLFQAPEQLTEGEQENKYRRLSIWVRQPLTASDSPLQQPPLQKIATIIVRGSKVDGVELSQENLDDLFKPDADREKDFLHVPPYLLPIEDSEVTIQAQDADGGRGNDGKIRARRVIYSGWGGGGFPAGGTTRGNELQLYNGNPQNPKGAGDLGVVSGTESMMIDCRKFNDDPEVLSAIRHHMLLNTAEEWTVSNFTMSLFKETGDVPQLQGAPADVAETLKKAGIDDPRPIWLTSEGKTEPYPSPAQKSNITTRGVDHPFHIHINPFWVTGIFDWAGRPLNWNYELLEDGETFEPRWQDVIRLPRNGGYVKFRSRFWDYAGEYVNHCHILQHEDNGMMEGIAVVPKASEADYILLEPGEELPPPDFLDCYTLDWGIADLVQQGDQTWVRAGPADPHPERDKCDEILNKLNLDLRDFRKKQVTDQ
jgi:FtsP/CotA-like multicopper oxidase with cupredoxin domain